MLRRVLSKLTANGISLLGTAVACAAFVLILAFQALHLFGFEGGPYLGILTFLILPAIMAGGLVLIPAGLWLSRRRSQGADSASTARNRLPVMDLNSASTRGALVTGLMLSIAVVTVLAGASYKGVEVIGSNEFCGLACHTVMEPEYTAYQRSAHAQVDCADCHIGPGAEWFVKSKLSGAWQLVAVTFDLYPKPIPNPVHNLRPARETCEQCHWTEKFYGDRLEVITHYDEDEANTELTSAILLKVGGQQGRKSSGIHWHVDPNNQIRYRSDETREVIYDVELTQADGSVKVFRKGDAPEDAEWRVMDCVDCHNRPTHQFRLPDQEVDLAIVEGRINRELPFIKREAVKALAADYPSHEAARVGIASAIDGFYGSHYPEIHASMTEAIAEAGSALGDIYGWNVFPQMKVTWGTYPEHIGHVDNGGCFRCHDKRHRTETRERIGKDCDSCHTVLAEREASPEALEELLGL